MELPENDLSSSASLLVQQQLYQMNKSWKMAAFTGCEGGEIEVGMSSAAASGGQMNLQASLEQVFSEEFFQQSQLEELLQLPLTRPSSSSSLLSVSAGNPTDCSTSLLRTMAMSSATPSPQDLTVAPLLHPCPPHRVPFGRHGHIHFPSAEADDAAMAQAMLTVISAASSSALPTPSTPPPRNHRAQRRPRRGSTTAFQSYNSALAPRSQRRPPGAPGQRMIKMGISILRRMHTIGCTRERTAGAVVQRGQEEEEEAAAAPSSSQLNHVIAERRRRESLNESFEALRGLLPPGSKNDKVTVLAKTLEYLNLLIAQISDLEALNRRLESQIHQRINGSSTSRTVNEVRWLISGSPERVHVQVSSGAGASSIGVPPRRDHMGGGAGGVRPVGAGGPCDRAAQGDGPLHGGVRRCEATKQRQWHCSGQPNAESNGLVLPRLESNGLGAPALAYSDAVDPTRDSTGKLVWLRSLRSRMTTSEFQG